MILNMANVATEFLTKVCFQQLVQLSLNPIISVALKQVDWNFVTLKLVNVQVSSSNTVLLVSCNN